MELKLRDFESQILFFNGMYKLPIAPYPCTVKVIEHEASRAPMEGANGKAYLIRRLHDLHKILTDEVNEVTDIIDKLKLGQHLVKNEDGTEHYVPYTEADFLTDMADWLVDLQVYEASEMAKFGLPLKESQKIVMSSNFSKLDANGQPIYDGNGKVQKGPMYWKPEPQLNAMIQEKIGEAQEPTPKLFDLTMEWK
jgi:hypothetical protein